MKKFFHISIFTIILMESLDIYPNIMNECQSVSTAEVNQLTPVSFSQNYSIINTTNPETSSFELSDNININNEKNIIYEKRKIKVFKLPDKDNSEKEKQKKIQEKENENEIKEENESKEDENEDIFNRKSLKKFKLRSSNLKSSLKTSLKSSLKTSLKSNLKSSFIPQRSTLRFTKNLPKSLLENKVKSDILRKTLMMNNDFNKMRRISIKNFNQFNKESIHIKNNNIKNFVKYENMFLEDELYLRAPGSFPDEEETNIVLKLNFLEENNYLDEDNISNNDYIEQPFLRQMNSVGFNSNFEKNIKSKFLKPTLTFDKIEEEDDGEENNINDRITVVNNSIKNIYNDENEISGKNILYAEKFKISNNFKEGSFNKNLVTFENESKIAFISINLFIKKIALFNFRINFPILYKAFLQQYTIFLSAPLFIEKIIQAFELYYNNNNKIASELVNILNIVIADNYEKIKDDIFLLEKIKDFYSYLKIYIYTEANTALEQEVDNIYYLLFEADLDEDEEINYLRKFVLQRRKSNSIFIKSKTLYNNIFNKIKDDKKPKKRRLFKTRTTILYKYFYIFAHTTMEIAQYLTCISYQMMRNINQKELLNKNFASNEKLTKAPNVMKMIDRFNKLVLFIIEDIFSYDTKKQRCECIEKWVEIALKLKELHNYNDLVMINTCFVNLTLNKLKLTFKKLSNKCKTIIKEMNAFCSSNQCYINIRKMIFNSKGIPYIPYLGIILKEIISIEEMKYIINENNINFDKIVKLYNVLNRFNEFKKSKFTCEKSKELDILINLKPKTEDELEEIAKQLEPKLKILALRGNKKRLTNTDKFYYDKNFSESKKVI